MSSKLQIEEELRMCQPAREHVMKLLEEHTISVRKITQLRYELEHPPAGLRAPRREDILTKLTLLEGEVDRLETYVGLLPPRQEVLLRRHYFEGASWYSLCEELGLSSKTIRKLRRRAVDTLAEMYEFAGMLA